MIYQLNHSLSADYFTFEYGNNLTFPLHIHSCFEIIAITDGEMTVQIESKDYVLHKGDVIFIFPYQIHSTTTKTKSAHTLCIFSSEIVALFYRLSHGKIPENPVINLKEPSVFFMFTKSTNDDDLMKIKGILYLMFSELIKSTELVLKKKKSSSFLELLDKIFTFVNENYTEECSLKKISKELKYDYSYLSKFFSEFVGMSFNEYINRVRISKACYMLKNTDNIIIKISDACGFSSLRSFNRNFVKITGMTPTEYRNAV